MTTMTSIEYINPKPSTADKLGRDIPNGTFFLFGDGGKSLIHKNREGGFMWVSDSDRPERPCPNGFEKSVILTDSYTFVKYEPVDVKLIVTRK